MTEAGGISGKFLNRLQPLIRLLLNLNPNMLSTSRECHRGSGDGDTREHRPTTFIQGKEIKVDKETASETPPRPCWWSPAFSADEITAFPKEPQSRPVSVTETCFPERSWW